MLFKWKFNASTILANSCWTSTLHIKIPSLPRNIKYLLRLVLPSATCVTTTSVLCYASRLNMNTLYIGIFRDAQERNLRYLEARKVRRDEGSPFNRSAIRAWTLTTLALTAASPLFRHRFGELFGDGPSESPGRARRIERKAQLGRASEWPFFSNRKASRGAHMTSQTTVRECFSFAKAIDYVSILYVYLRAYALIYLLIERKCDSCWNNSLIKLSFFDVVKIFDKHLSSDLFFR